jgi:hypothetical protein
MNCTEQVTQTKLGDHGKIIEEHTSAFDYLILLSSTSEELSLVESRIAVGRENERSQERSPLLLSNGFATLFLIFHPYYSGGFEFRVADEEVLKDRTLTKIHFRHIHGTRSPAALSVRGREYPLDLEGDAWIDPQTSVISRIEATLGSSMDDVGLRSLRAVIDYGSVSFQSPSQVLWLPAQVVVEVESRRQHWRNTHMFTKYKRFSVNTEEQIRNP